MFTSTFSLEVSTSFCAIGIIIAVIIVFTKTLAMVGHYKNIKKKNTKYNCQALKTLAICVSLMCVFCLNLWFIFTNEA